MNFLEALRSDPQKVRSLRRPDLANHEEGVLGAGNCDPKS
jgi:hypothetical protein